MPRVPQSAATRPSEETLDALRATALWVTVVVIFSTVALVVLVTTGLETARRAVGEGMPAYLLGLSLGVLLIVTLSLLQLGRYMFALHHLRVDFGNGAVEAALRQQATFWRLAAALCLVGWLLLGGALVAGMV